MVAVGLYAYDEGGVALVGLAAVVRMVPAALAAPALALLADRWPRRRVLVLACSGRAVVLFAAAVVITVGGPFVVVLALVAGGAAMATVHKPAHLALIPGLVVTPAQLASANVATSVGDYLGFLVGPVAVGFAVAVGGPAWGLLVGGGSVALAAVAVLGLPRSNGVIGGAPVERGSVLSGISTVLRAGELRTVTLLFLLTMVVQGVLDVLLVLTALELLGTGQAGVGLLSGAWGLGGLATGLVLATIGARARLARLLLVGMVVAGLPVLLVGVLADAPSALLLLAVTGVGFALVEVALLTFTQRLATTDVLARVFGVQELCSVLGTALGGVVAPLLVVGLGVDGALVAAGAVLPVAALLLGWNVRNAGATVTAPAEVFALLRRVPIFAGLSIATVETLAVHARERAVTDGEVLLREGATGDRMFVIAEGAQQVTADGPGELAVLGVGDWVGEIALLRDQPRSATVAARGNGRVLVIERDVFLGAVSTHGATLGLVDEVASLRLEEIGR
jgi:MFS family permease